MSNIVLDETQLGRLWNKCLNTFELRGGYSNATVIWTNSSPTSEFSSKTISSLPDLSTFRYFIFEWKESATDAGTKQEVYINNFYQSTPTSGFAIDRFGYIYTSGNRCFRYFQRVANSNTSLYFADCYNIVGASSSSVSNADCIPIRILGCNELKPTIVSNYVDTIYPVGAIYTSINATSPASLFGGTWESLGQIKLSNKIVAGNDTGSAWDEVMVFSALKTGGTETALYTPGGAGNIANTFTAPSGYNSGTLYYHSGLTLNGTSVYAWKRIS